MNLRIKRSLLAVGLILSFAQHSAAQINQPGSFHLAAGVSFGFHGTIYESVVSAAGINVVETQEDGAITVTVPIDVQFGIIKPISVGAYIEPGMYLDSSATRSNALFMAGLKPRFYLVQNEHFTWMMDARFGMNFLNIDDFNDVGLKKTEKYSGPHFGIGTGIGSYFGVVGFNVGLAWQRNSFTLQNLTIDNSNIDAVEAELDTEGIHLNAQVAVKF